MQSNIDPLGTCPECGSALVPADVIVEYETDNGHRYYAECPACETVVHPV
ncbi:DUF7837 family putative zinc-binding protein [Halosimplex amylolyticum]